MTTGEEAASTSISTSKSRLGVYSWATNSAWAAFAVFEMRASWLGQVNERIGSSEETRTLIASSRSGFYWSISLCRP